MSARRSTADAFNLGAGNADVMMLYQAIAETRACGGEVGLDFPHPDKPLRFTFQFTARRPVVWDGVVYARPGELAEVDLRFNINGGAPDNGGRPAFYGLADARDRLLEFGFDEDLADRVLAKLGWPR